MFFKKIISFIAKLLPVKLIATTLYLGMLSTWQRYWSAFLGYITCSGLIVWHAHILKIDIFNIYLTRNIVILMSPILFLVVFLTLLAIFMVFLYQMEEGVDEGTITIDAFLGSMWTIILAFPGIISIRDFGYLTLNIVCGKLFECNSVPYFISNILLMFFLPFFMFCLLDKWKFWPSEKLLSNFGGVFSRKADILISSLYCSLFIYLFAFVAMKMPLAKLVDYYKGILMNFDNHLITMIKEFRIYGKDLDLSTLIEKIKK